MAIEAPQVGCTYVSQIDSSMLIYVVDVVIPDVDEDIGTTFIVEGCDPAYKDDLENADGLELTAETWKKHNFTLVAD
jgi:hypothetical protein